MNERSEANDAHHPGRAESGASAPPEAEAVAAPARTDLPKVQGSAGLFRRLLVFQFKLLLDGLRDVILSPASVIAVLMGVFGTGRPDGPFRALLRFGRRTDDWIDLFDAHSAADEGEAEGESEARAEHDRPEASANALFDAVERAVREEYERGGGRSAIEARLQSLRERRQGPQ